MPTIRAAAAVGAVLGLLVTGCSDDGAGEADPVTTTTPTTERAEPSVALELEGPITGGERGLPYNAMPLGFEEDYGYIEEEYFVSGTATAFDPAGPLAADGIWELHPGATAEYTTRILVRQPADPADFNGVVLVEWNNVTVGRDSDPGFGLLYPEVLAAGYGYIGASVQQVSIEGGESLLEIPGVPEEATLPLKEWDPVRYAPLEHPGDEFSYDMFSQIGALAEGRASASPFDGLQVETVIALGESQSAGQMVSYVNGVHPLAETYDGFMIHSRGAGAGSFGVGEDAPAGVPVRDDLSEPVLLFVTETDLTFLGYLGARQPDSDRIITWEVAGTAHADQSTLDYGVASGRRWSDAPLDFTALCGRVNTGPQAEVAPRRARAAAGLGAGGDHATGRSTHRGRRRRRPGARR